MPKIIKKPTKQPLTLDEAIDLLRQIDDYFFEAYGKPFYAPEPVGAVYHRPLFIRKLKELFPR